jgi:C1A family cysteine protease
MKVAAVVALVAAAHAAEINLVAQQPTFEEWQVQFGKTYVDDATVASKKAVYLDNVQYIDAHNALYAAGKSTFDMGVNEFSDMTHEEFKAMFVGAKIPARNASNVRLITNINSKAPDSVDWRTKGAVTPVKNQGQCGSCWSFSTTGSVEGRVQIATGKLTSLSEQQLMDCSTAEGDHSCQGGLMDYAFKYIIENHGIDSEADYPYKERNEACDKSKEKNVVSTISGYHDVTPNNADQFAAAIAEGPVSVAIEADQRAFQSYKSGVFSAACGTKLDHGVLAVGYTADAWIVKNSWGPTWGDEGYIQMARNGAGNSGQCGILMQPSYPVAGSAPPSPPGPNPPPPPPPPGPSPSSGHYGDPKNGCESDEESVQITGVSGDFCSPKCTGVLFKHCPTDVPDGATAKPECVLETQGSNKPTQCALICTPSANSDAQCPTGATCKAISGTGICTYDD